MHTPPQNPAGNSYPAIELVPVIDPVAGAFTIQMPKGWRNQPYFYTQYGLNKPMATTSSPNNEIIIYLGEPNFPNFMEPASMADPNMQLLVSMNLGYRVAPFAPAQYFFMDYVQQKFGSLPGFRITHTGPSPAYHQQLVQSAGQQGANFYTTTICIAFSYTFQGSPMRCLIHGTTISTGQLWIADVFGISARHDPEPYQSVALQMLASIRYTPQWLQHQRIMHEQQMAHMRMSEQNLRYTHQQNMANLHRQSESHQMRMHTMQESFQASNQQWMENHLKTPSGSQFTSTSNDVGHEKFIHAIREEHTVMDVQGNTFQVDNKHERYYINKQDGTYIGTDKFTELSDLGRTNGIDISKYEEVKIIR